jgi:hypothetical protein
VAFGLPDLGDRSSSLRTRESAREEPADAESYSTFLYCLCNSTKRNRNTDDERSHQASALNDCAYNYVARSGTFTRNGSYQEIAGRANAR